jgi:hypothetical protein
MNSLGLPDQQFHLVLRPQLQLLQAHFLRLLFIRKVRFGEECPW